MVPAVQTHSFNAGHDWMLGCTQLVHSLARNRCCGKTVVWHQCPPQTMFRVEALWVVEQVESVRPWISSLAFEPWFRGRLQHSLYRHDDWEQLSMQGRHHFVPSALTQYLPAVCRVPMLPGHLCAGQHE